MPELKWDAFEFFYCLEVEPEIEEYEISYAYEVRRDGFVLNLTVYPLESLVCLSLYGHDREVPLIELAIFVHGKVRYIKDKRGEYLEFADCILAPCRSSYREEFSVWDKIAPQWTVELSIKPQISIRYQD